MLKDLLSETFFILRCLWTYFEALFLDISLKVIKKNLLVMLICCKSLSCQCQVVFKLQYLIICCSWDTFLLVKLYLYI